MTYKRKVLPKKVALPPPGIALISQAVVPRKNAASAVTAPSLNLEDKV